jgi:hypothetical protein
MMAMGVAHAAERLAMPSKMSRVIRIGLQPESNIIFMAICWLDQIQRKTLGSCQKIRKWPAKNCDSGAQIMKNKAIFPAGTLAKHITNKDMKAM